ncbi:unnamed protein product, partial [Meganyctiphanes norvegica]
MKNMSSSAWQTPTPLRRLAADTIVWTLIDCCSPENWPYEIETNYESQNDDYFVNDYFLNDNYDDEEYESEDEPEPGIINNDHIAPFYNVNNGNAALDNVNNDAILINAIPQEINENLPANAYPINENPLEENNIPD